MAYTALNEAKDKAGKTVGVGSVCIYLGSADDDHGRGDKVIVRAIAAPHRDAVHAKGKLKGQPVRPFGVVHLRVDDAIDKPDADNRFGWSAWVCEDQIVAL
jgi:hypothetical protein